LKTRIWYIYTDWSKGNPLVIASDTELDEPGKHLRLRVRSITGRAAARKFIKNNLARELAELEYSDRIMVMPGVKVDITKDQVKEYKKYERTATIEIRKTYKPLQKCKRR
jgi:hypothetical protein